MTTCRVSWCGEPAIERDLCAEHYRAQMRLRRAVYSVSSRKLARNRNRRYTES